MTVLRYALWPRAPRFQTEVDRSFDAPQTSGADPGSWLPPVDVHEENNRYLLQVDLPGIEPNAVEITCEQGVLTIRGRRESSRHEAREGYRRIERISGEFERRFSLPNSADVANIQATVRNGVLEVAVPKLARAEPKRIAVAAA